MGSCFSKPAEERSVASKQFSPQVVKEPYREQPGPPASNAEPQHEKISAATPPAAIAAWSAGDVTTWAATLGLPAASLLALEGVTGQQLVSLTDQRLLQLGVQDAAERQALLSARSTLQTQHATDAGAGGVVAAAVRAADDKQALLASDAAEGGAGAAQNAAAVVPQQPADQTASNDVGPDTPASNGKGVRFGLTGQQSSSNDTGAGQSDSQVQQLTAGADTVQEELVKMQLLRITSTGRIFRRDGEVPTSLVPFCQALCLLHDLRRGAHYHYDNCHQLLQRCVIIQDYLMALPHSELQQQTVLLTQLSLFVQDAYDLFSQFSERGWLLRLLNNSVRDQDDFNRLDAQLVKAVQQAGVDTSAQPLADLRKPRMYAPQQQQLEAALKNYGGMHNLMRDPLSATLRLQVLMHHLPSGTNIDTLLQQEIDYYLSSQLWYTYGGSRPASRDNSFNRTGSGSSSGGNSMGRANSGGSNHGSSSGGMLRRTSSMGLPGSRGRTPAVSVVEPFMVLRNDVVRSEWRAAFGPRERITWKEFWNKLVAGHAHLWGLDQQLDKFTTDYVQQHLQRASHGLLTIAELDFAFPPNASPAMVIQAKLKEHSSSSGGLHPVSLPFGSSGPAPASKSKSRPGCAQGPGGANGWLSDVRLLHEPIPRLHNFPEFPPSYHPREEDVAELVLGMADVSTNLVMLTGASGVGRSMLAASLAQELVSSHQWTDAYWIDLQGVNNVVLAGQQLMAGLGLISDVPDTQHLLAWLEGRPRERFGIVLTHIQELLTAPAEEQQGFLDLLDNILHSSHKLQVVVVCEEPLNRITYSARTVDVEPMTPAASAQMLEAAQPGISPDMCQFLVDACQGAPVALAVVCGLLRCGHCTAAEFLRIYSDPSLPIERSMSDASSTSFLPFESRITNERLQRLLVAAAVALPDELVTGLLVLSLLPAPFSVEMAAPLLALPATNNERHSVLRRLVSLGLLIYNASLQRYSMHKLVREAAQLLVHNLGLPYMETRRRFADLLVSSARRLVLPLMAKNGMLSARLAWSRLSVHIVQLLNWAFQEVREDMLHIYVTLAWDLMPLLSSSCSAHTLQGFCQVVVERAQFLDAHLESAQVMTVLASLLTESGALKRADAMLRQALELFWRELKGPHTAVARCYKELGSLMLKAGKAGEASKYLQQALEMTEQLFGSSSAELLPVLQLQVELLRRSRKYGEAEGVCQRALGICGAAFGPADVQVAVWKNHLAQVVRQAGRLSEAQSLAQEALSLLQGQLGSEHPRVAAQLMMLGQLAAQQGRQLVAEQTYRKALQVYQSVSGLHHPDTFNCLTLLVSLLRSAGKAMHALPLAQRCLAVKKKSLGELHPDTAASMQVVADVMLDLGRYAEVESNCSRAVWVYQQLNQPSNSKPVITATTMQALALVLLGRANEAEQLANSCLEAAKQMQGSASERNSFVASCQNCLGEVLREMGRVADAEAAAREGLAIREKEMGSQHAVVAMSLQTLGHILRMRQQLQPALDAAQRCESIRSGSNPQAQGPAMAAVLFLQALIYLDMGKLGEALEKGQAALTIRQKVLTNEHPDLAHSLAVVSEVLLMQGKHGEAEPLLSHAVQIFIAQLGSSHPATQRAHMLLKQATNPRSFSGSIMPLRLASSTELGSVTGSRVASGSASSAELPSQQLLGEPSPVAQTAGQQQQPATGQELAPTGSEGSKAAAEAAAVAGGLSAGHQAASAEAAAAASRSGEAMLSSAAPTSNGELGLAASSTSAVISILNNIPAAASTASGVADDMACCDSKGSFTLYRTHSATTAAAMSAASAEGLEQQQAADSGLGLARQASLDSSVVPSASGRPAGDGSTAMGSSALAQSCPPVARTALGMERIDEGAVAAPSDPAEWELGRQFGQPVSLAGGATDADLGAGAYTKVLHELTRRSSIGSHGEDRDKESLVSTAAPVLPAAAPEEVDADAAAAAAAAEAEAAEAALEEAAREAAAIDAEAEEAAETAKEDDKLAKLRGIGDIEHLRSFLREHGWQLSRLSEDREGSMSSLRSWQGSRESSHTNAAGAAHTGELPADVMRRMEDARAAKSERRPPARHYSFLHKASSQLEAVVETPTSSPSAYEHDLAEQEQEEEEAAAVAAGAEAMAGHGFAAAAAGPSSGALGMQSLPMPGSVNQSMMVGPSGLQQLYLQPYQQQSLDASWGQQYGYQGMPHGYQGMDAQQAIGLDEEAEAEELYRQQLATATEAEAALQRIRAEQTFLVSQQAQLRSRGFAPHAASGAALTTGNAELLQRLMQIRHQQYGSGEMYSADDADGLAAAAFQAQRGQVPQAWMQQHAPTAAGGGYQQGSRRRRDSWDGPYPPNHPLHGTAAAAAAACGYNMAAGGDPAAFEPLLQQQHSGGMHQVWPGVDHSFGPAPGLGLNLAPLQTAASGGMMPSLPGSGGSRGSIQSAAAAAAAFYGPAVAQALQAPRAQQSPMSPAGSAHADVLPGPAVMLGPRAVGLLPKYPSNISSYSAGSGRSLTLDAAVDVQQQLNMQHAQPGGEYWASHMAPEAAFPAAAAEAAGSRAASRLGQHADVQQQQQQHEQPSAGKTRPAAALMGRASSGPVVHDPQGAAAAAAAAAAGPQQVARTSETGAPPAASSRTPAGSAGLAAARVPTQRGVAFNMRQQAAQDGGVAEQEYVDLSPEAVAAAAAGLRAGLQGRPRSPFGGYDEMLQQPSPQHPGPHGMHDGGMMEEEGYSAVQGAGLVRPHTAGSTGSGQLRGTGLHPAPRMQSTPTRTRAPGSSMGWPGDGGVAGMMPHESSLSRQQQLLLQQQVLQVQAARLELQQQQLEIEQLLEQQQHQLQAAVGQWPGQQQQQQQHTPGGQARQPLAAGAGFMAYHGQGGLPAAAGMASQVHGLQQAASIASTASVGSPTHMAGPLESDMAAGVVGAPGHQHNHGLPHIATGPSPQSSMHTPAGSTAMPSSPSGSSSLSSRPALSRGASDNQEAQVAASMSHVMAAMAGAGSNGTAVGSSVNRLGSSKGLQQQQQQQLLQGLRPQSPLGVKRGVAAAGAAGLAPGNAAALAASGGASRQTLHRLQHDNSYDVNLSDADAMMLPSMYQQHQQRAGHGMGYPTLGNLTAVSGVERQQRLPPNWQQQQQQMLAQAGLMAPHVLQQQVPGASRLGPPRLPPHSRQYPAAGGGLGGSAHLPAAAPSPSSGPVSWRTAPHAAAGQSAVYAGAGPVAVRAGSFVAPSAVYGGAPAASGAPQHPGMLVGGRSAGMSFSSTASAGLLPQRSPSQGMTDAQIAQLNAWQQAQQHQQQHQHQQHQGAEGVPLSWHMLQQQQQQLQQQAMLYQHDGQGHSMSAATAAAVAAGLGASPDGASVAQQAGHRDESSDYEIWAAPPDYGNVNQGQSGVTSAEPGSRTGSVTKSFIAPGGGQYWDGRRSNSFSNLQESDEAADLAVVAGRTIMRSKSSEDIVAGANREGGDMAVRGVV